MAWIGIFLPTFIFILATTMPVQAMSTAYAMEVDHKVDTLYMTYKCFYSRLCPDVCVHIFKDLFFLLSAGLLEHLKIYVLDSHQKYSDFGFVWIEKLNICDIQALLEYLDMICKKYSSSLASCLLKKSLLEVGVNLYKITDIDKNTVLHYAHTCSLETLEVLLDVAYAMDMSPENHRAFFEFVCKRNVNGQTALYKASHEGDCDVVTLLLAKISTLCDRGAQKFSYSYTYRCASYDAMYHKPPLHAAVMAEKQGTVMAIIDAVMCSRDRLALLQQRARIGGETPLELASKKIKPILKKYLKECLAQAKHDKEKHNCLIQ